VAHTRRGLALFVLFALLSGLFGLLGVRASTPDIQVDEGRSAALVNGARADSSLAGLATAADLREVAERHSREMAASGSLYHNGNLPNEVDGWDTLGENVGRGGSVDAVHDALMASDSHRHNILGPYGDIGVGVVWTGDTVYVTQVFRQPTAPAPPPEPAPESQPAPAPPPPPPPADAPPAEEPTRVLAAGRVTPLTEQEPAPAPVAEPAPAPTPRITPATRATLAAVRDAIQAAPEPVVAAAPAPGIAGGVAATRAIVAGDLGVTRSPPPIAALACALLLLVTLAQLVVVWRRMLQPAHTGA
jgi:hypothetical protein